MKQTAGGSLGSSVLFLVKVGKRFIKVKSWWGAEKLRPALDLNGQRRTVQCSLKNFSLFLLVQNHDTIMFNMKIFSEEYYLFICVYLWYIIYYSYHFTELILLNYYY